MSTEDLKRIVLIPKTGGQIELATRMPVADLYRELRESATPWIELSCIDSNGERVEFNYLRELFGGFVIGKLHAKSNIAIPRPILQ